MFSVALLFACVGSSYLVTVDHENMYGITIFTSQVQLSSVSPHSRDEGLCIPQGNDRARAAGREQEHSGKDGVNAPAVDEPAAVDKRPDGEHRGSSQP